MTENPLSSLFHCDIAGFRFSPARHWNQAVAPPGGGLYAVLLSGAVPPAQYELFSVGQSDNLAGWLLSLRRGPTILRLLSEVAPRGVYISWLQSPLFEVVERTQVEGEIIEKLLPHLRTYKLFVSHSWDYSDEYEGLVALLEKEHIRFRFRNLSIPQRQPVLPHPVFQRSYRALIRELEERISSCDCVLVLSGMYLKHSEWIQSEIEAAVDHRKPIIGVEPRGQERIPPEVRAVAREMVGWQSKSVITAIRAAVDAVPGAR